MTPRLRLLAVAVAAVAVLSACGSFQSPAAVVNGEPITDEEVRETIPLFDFLASLSGQTCGRPERGEPPEAACARFVLSNLIQEHLVKTYASAHGITVPPGDVARAIQPLAEQLGGEAALRQRLRQQRLNEADLRELTARLLLFREVRRAVTAETLSEADLRSAYRARRLEFTSIHVAHILVRKRQEAKRIASRATPRNFASLARRFSTDRRSATRGGDLGVIPAADLDPTFVEAAMALRPGEVSEPVRTRFGWHLIRLIDLRVVPFGRVKEQLLDEAGDRAFAEWLRKQAAGAEIRVNPRYGRYDPRTEQVVPITSTSVAQETEPGS